MFSLIEIIFFDPHSCRKSPNCKGYEVDLLEIVSKVYDHESFENNMLFLCALMCSHVKQIDTYSKEQMVH